jgi:hypothetical protein
MEGIMGLVSNSARIMNLFLMITEFAYYFEEQNKAIHDKSLKAEEINLVALGINNG